MSFGLDSPTATDVASGARLLVDVEFEHHGHLYALSQGDWVEGEEGSPAEPNTGKLLNDNEGAVLVDRTFIVVTDGLNQPTSVEFIDHIAYMVTLGREVWQINFESIDAEAIMGAHCADLTGYDELTAAWVHVVAGADSDGFGLHMWATIVESRW